MGAYERERERSKINNWTEVTEKKLGGNERSEDERKGVKENK